MDQGTKYFALHLLPSGERVQFGWITLHTVFNPDGFGSLLHAFPDSVKSFFLFGVVSLLIVLGGYFCFFKTSLSQKQRLCLALILAGASGNLLDRCLHHEGVIDFIQVSLPFYRTGIFNIADIFILVGASAFGYWYFQKL